MVELPKASPAAGLRLARPVLLVAALMPMVALLATGPASAQWQMTSVNATPMAERGHKLLDRFARGESIRLVAFGDSLTAGWGTDGRHVYYRMVADALQVAFPDNHLEVIAHGHPGETTEGALRRFDAEVRSAKPDLLLVQFGGNDKGWGRSVGDFRRDLGELLRRASAQTGALVIACLPPIVDPDPRNQWNETARAVAAQQGVPAADLDRAIRQGDADSRGPFPYGSHPKSFTHVIMAHEVLRSLREAVGLGPAPTCRLGGGARLSARTQYDLRLELSDPSDMPSDCSLQLEWQDECTADALHLAPRQTTRLERTIPLPTFTGQSRRLPVRALARVAGFGDIDVRWLTVAPAVRADTAAADGVGADAPTWHNLTDGSFTLGRHQWWGPGDLSGRFAVVALADRIRFIVDVTDNDITVAAGDDPSEGDSAELYLDLRDDENQGKPIYGPDVIALQISPPPVEGAAARWRSMQPLPARLDGLTVSCAKTAGGYRAQVDLPLAAVIASRGKRWQGLGFDIGVNDADLGGLRKSQMMWTGYPDDYLDPACFAGLYTEELPPGATRQTLW